MYWMFAVYVVYVFPAKYRGYFFGIDRRVCLYMFTAGATIGL